MNDQNFDPTSYQAPLHDYAEADWHSYTENSSDYDEDEREEYEPLVGYLYNYDNWAVIYYSILRMKEVEALLDQMRNGAKLDFQRFLHFTDAHILQVKEIIQSKFFFNEDDYNPSPFYVAFTHLIEFENSEVAEAIALELMHRGYDIESAAEGYLTADSENPFDPNDWLVEFVTKCKAVHLNTSLSSTLAKKLNLRTELKKI